MTQMSDGRYPQALATVVRGSAVPYGYTLTIWTTGAVLERGHGTPAVGDIFLFLAGAVAGFMLVAVGVRRLDQKPLAQTRGELTRTGIVQIIAVGSSLGAAALVALISGPVVWPLAAFLATLVYLLVAAMELATVHRDDDRVDPQV